jgi:bla regulator protein BlaR1
MITYFLKSATCLALLLLFYHFILEKEKMHTFNRFYLLGSVLFSLLAPLYIIYIDVAPLIIRTTQTSTTSYPTEITSEIML